MNYLNVIERYREHREGIRELLASILSGTAAPELIGDSAAVSRAMQSLAAHYPFADLLYTLDRNGIQTSDNISSEIRPRYANSGQGMDRSQRPYFILARDTDKVIVTEPYLSCASNKLCMSAVVQLHDKASAQPGYLVMDFDLAKTIAFFMGDSSRGRFQPLFKSVYVLIVLGLLSVVAVLLYSAFTDIATLFQAGHTLDAIQLKPFSVIIFITLALAIFDLGKTILEEEVLMQKDILRHSSTRRTITRFIAAILIAVSIEALMLMFKGALSNGVETLQGVWMMLTAVGLLAGLGLYVYFGARAEAILLGLRK
ncbi:MAG: PDC sensor domain-containing protein [Gammaproteobacteria bacterium]|nr:PDC sensor domain-containing protein [Gammaproteobacteria bacterium]